MESGPVPRLGDGGAGGVSSLETEEKRVSKVENMSNDATLSSSSLAGSSGQRTMTKRSREVEAGVEKKGKEPIESSSAASNGDSAKAKQRDEGSEALSERKEALQKLSMDNKTGERVLKEPIEKKAGENGSSGSSKPDVKKVEVKIKRTDQHEEGRVDRKIKRIDRWGNVILDGDQESTSRSSEHRPPTKEELDWEMKWAITLSKWRKYQRNPERFKKIKVRIRKGIADSVRGSLWPKLCGAEFMLQKAPNRYQQLLAMKLSHKDEEQINKDLHRTDSRNVFFFNKGTGQESLYNVLKAYALYNPKVGYCQGMGTLASLLLTYVPEELAFWMMERLMDDPKYKCAGLFEDGFPEAFKLLDIHDKLLKKYDSKLFKCLQKKNVQTMAYAFRWYQGRFYEFPKEIFIRIMDIFLLEGRKILFRVAMYLLISRRKQFFAATEDTAKEIARDIRDDPYTKDVPDADALIQKALSVKLSRSYVDKLEKKYDKEHKDMMR